MPLISKLSYLGDVTRGDAIRGEGVESYDNISLPKTLAAALTAYKAKIIKPVFLILKLISTTNLKILKLFSYTV